MLYPKEDKENRILLYAVSTTLRSPRGFPEWSTCSQCGLNLLHATLTPFYAPYEFWSRFLSPE